MAEKNLVLIGGGHSHILLLKKMGMKPIKGLNITLVTPDPELVYTGMLPAAILGAYSFDQIKIDLNTKRFISISKRVQFLLLLLLLLLFKNKNKLI